MGIRYLEAEPFARLPEQFHKQADANRWLEENLREARRQSLLEGPSFDRDSKLYLVDVPFGRIFVVDYFTDQGQTGLHDPSTAFRLTRDGALSCVMSGIPTPKASCSTWTNRPCMSPSRDNAIRRLPFRLVGTVSKAGASIRMSGGTGPDGLALNAEGGLAVAHVGTGCAWIFSALGEPRQRINAPTHRSFGH